MQITEEVFSQAMRDHDQNINSYLENTNKRIGIWGSSCSPISNMDDLRNCFQFDANTNQSDLYELISQFIINENNIDNTISALEHRNGLQAMYVMNILLNCNPQIQEYRNELLVAALLHDYKFNENDEKSLLKSSFIVDKLNLQKILEFINYTNYSNNNKTGLCEIDNERVEFQYLFTQNRYAILMQLSDILGEQGCGNYLEYINQENNGQYSTAFGILIEFGEKVIKINRDDHHIRRALMAQRILQTT